MTVLCLAFFASVPLWSDRLAAPERSVALTFLFMLAAGVPVLCVLSGLVTVAYVLPLVALAHRFGRRGGRGERRRHVVAATFLGLLPAAVLPTLVLVARSGGGEWRQLAANGAVAAAALWTATAPAALAVHLTLRRERAGRPVRPVIDILLWGTLGLGVEYTGLLVFA
ncbi:hypothetical protein ACFUJY_18185 [Streptomyces sp. NPDC057249]|uniref:hypothetical protein n=1 Tax=Streptomyces sp. NPDC057249 TaxID=3346067 RepID=UPI003640B64C